MRAWRTLALVAIVVCSVWTTPALASASQTEGATQNRSGPTEYSEIARDLQSLAAVDIAQEADLAPQQRRAAVRGARQGARLAQAQGVDVTQQQLQASVDAAVSAAARTQQQRASVEQIQAAAKGATHGGLIQSQTANIRQLQAGVYGGTAGALSQSQNASVVQIQSASFGATHGAIAQHQQANITQIQAAAIGGSAGAVSEATQTQRLSVSQIQEAAQGGTYGSLSQNQTISIRQVQAAAFGAAGGGVAKGRRADPKKIQEASLGAAHGALFQKQEATVEQVQAAARGACEGSLEQSQSVSIVQIQQISVGASQGAISQFQQASARQIQAAATGASRGAVTQIQNIEITQIQVIVIEAAAAAADNAAQTDTDDPDVIIQQAVTNVEQNVDITINATQREDPDSLIVSRDGQNVTIRNPNSVAVTVAVTIAGNQTQTIDIGPTSSVTERLSPGNYTLTAETDDGQSVTLDGESEFTVNVPPPEFTSVNASVQGRTAVFDNPNDRPVVVTIENETQRGTVRVDANGAATRQLSPGQYNVSARTAQENFTVPVNEQPQATITVEALPSVNATVDNRTLTVENPADVAVTVRLRDDDNETSEIPVAAGTSETRELDPGNYTLTAVTENDISVLVNNESEYSFAVEPSEPGLESLNVSAENQTVSFENPNDVAVVATVEDDRFDARNFTVEANDTLTESFAHGNYTVTAQTEDGEPVPVNGQDEFQLTVEPTVESMNVTTTDGVVTVENPNSLSIVVSFENETGEQRSLTVGSNDSRTTTLSPGEYDVTAETEERRFAVPVNGQEEATITVEALPSAVASVDEQTLSVENPTDVRLTFLLTDENNETEQFLVLAGESDTRELDLGNYTLTAETRDDVPVQVNDQSEFTFEVEAPGPTLESLNLSVNDTEITVENPNDESVEMTVTDDTGATDSLEVAGDETVTAELPPGDYTASAETEDGETVQVNDQDEYSFSIEEADTELESLDVSTEDDELIVENPNDEPVVVNVENEDGETETLDIDDNETASAQLPPGEYTITAETEDGRTVQVNGQDELSITIEEDDTELESLTARTDDDELNLENPNDELVVVTATDEDGEEQTIDVPGDDTVSEALDPGEYTLTAETEDGEQVDINGSESLVVQISEPTDETETPTEEEDEETETPTEEEDEETETPTEEEEETETPTEEEEETETPTEVEETETPTEEPATETETPEADTPEPETDTPAETTPEPGGEGTPTVSPA